MAIFAVSVQSWEWDWDSLSRRKVDECTSVADGAAAEEVEQKRERVARNDAVDEQRLAFQRLGDRTGGRVVIGQRFVAEFGKGFENGRQV